MNFREIAEFMDPVEPATSMRRLLAMHQLDEEDGYGEVWRRHNHPEKKEKHFLFWNTFLMDFLRGITPDSRRGRWILGILTLGASEIARFHEELTAKWGKALIKRYTASPHDRPFKPAVEARAKEIGSLVFENASISAFCEVWTNREKEWLLDQWAIPPVGQNNKISERQLRSSGLITISNEFPVTNGGFHRYNAENGLDKIVGKGVLLTHVDVGFGPSSLDIYSTHLNAGDIGTKLAQFFELIYFIESSRVSTNPAVIVGDFNLNSYDGTIYSIAGIISSSSAPNAILDALRIGDGISREAFINLVNSLPSEIRPFVTGFNGTISELITGTLSLLGFKDLWKHRNELSSDEHKGYGYTNDLIQEGAADQICPVIPGSALSLCEELISAPIGANRIDYMFVSDTDPGQTFTLDFTRPIRFRADRSTDAPDFEEIAFMSDHLGLITTLIISPI